MKCQTENCTYEGSIAGKINWTCTPENRQPHCPNPEGKPKSEFQEGGNVKPAGKEGNQVKSTKEQIPAIK